MKPLVYTFLIGLSICLGWFLNNVATKYDARDLTYRDDLHWAGFAVLDIVGVLIIATWFAS